MSRIVVAARVKRRRARTRVIENYNSIIFLSDKNKSAYDDLVSYISGFEKILKKYQEIIANGKVVNIANYEDEINNLKFGNAAMETAEIERLNKRFPFDNLANTILSDWNDKKDPITKESGGRIFDYGFINVNNSDFKAFIEYMKNYPNVEWGGVWPQKDIMHFQLKASAQKELEICDEYKKE